MGWPKNGLQTVRGVIMVFYLQTICHYRSIRAPTIDKSDRFAYQQLKEQRREKMKLTKYVFVSLLSTAILLPALSQSVNAEEVVSQKKETPAVVTIKDNDDGTGTDPLDPTDPTQKNLTLEKVPTNYDFETKLQGETVEASSTLTDTIDVFNDRIDREWSVKANLADNELNLTKNSSKLAVNEFQINDVDLIGTGATGIVAKAAESKTAENNTGLVKTSVSNLSIKFTDKNRELKAGDTLEGTISYQLYNTPDAQ